MNEKEENIKDGNLEESKKEIEEIKNEKEENINDNNLEKKNIDNSIKNKTEENIDIEQVENNKNNKKIDELNLEKNDKKIEEKKSEINVEKDNEKKVEKKEEINEQNKEKNIVDDNIDTSRILLRTHFNSFYIKANKPKKINVNRNFYPRLYKNPENIYLKEIKRTE